MTETPVNSTIPKWEQISSVVTTVTQDLNNELGFGLALYPFPLSTDAVCEPGGVVVPIRDQNAAAISNALSSIVPYGGTPTSPTLNAVRLYLQNNPSTRTRAVVLATDGAPNCNSSLSAASGCTCSQMQSCDQNFACLDDADATAAVQELANDGFATFVIGIPGSDRPELFAGVLDRLADAGGTAVAGQHRYYDAVSATALEQSLRAIGQRMTTCRFELQNDPLSSAISVTVNGTPSPRDPTRTNGWDYVGVRTIEFFGAACEALAQGSPAVRVEYCAMPSG